MKKNKYDEFISKKLYSKYKISNTLYALNVIDNIIFNEKSHIVSTFKDYLILDDEFEFLKRYYNYGESIIRLKTFLSYYSKNKKQFPNYSSIKEAKFILKNITIKNIMAENLEKNPIKQRKEKIDINSKESLSNTIFNSKVYDSIINDSENCLSIFGCDKESLYNGSSNYSRNKNEDSINKLVNHFEELEKDITFTFGNKNDKIQKLDNSLIKNIDLENNYQTDRKDNNKKNQNIYKKKKTPNNSINRRKKNINSSTRTQKNFYKIKNHENVDYINYKNLVLYSESNHNPIKIISKKTNLNTSPNVPIRGKNTSMPHLDISPDHTARTKYIRVPNIFNKDNNISTLKQKKNKLNNNNFKIDKQITKDNLLTERIPPMIKVKINMKKNYAKVNNKNLIRKNDINKNQIKNSENKNKNIKIDKNKIFYLKQKAKIDNKSKIYNSNNKNIIKNNLINNNIEKNRDFFIKSIEKLNTLRSHSNNIMKDNKINIIKKNINHNINSEYLSNKYKNRLSNYNNYTSIQFNNNNINIINSNNSINNNIYQNTFGHYLQKSNDFNLFNNLSSIGNQSESLKNKRKKLNKKCISSIYSNDTEKIDKKFKFRKNLCFLENLNLLNSNNNLNEKLNFINNILQHQKGLNSERISTPFKSKQNKKIYLKVYKKVNMSNGKDFKNQTIANDTYKKYKNNFFNKKIIKYLNKSNNADICDKFNSTQMSIFNRTNTNMNSSNFNNSNYIGLNSSIYTKKNNKNENEKTYFNTIDKNDLFKNNLDLNNFKYK